ncbi:MAG: T9SS type A sorting domain-containing protein [Bacteroidetes bacterium]|nr:T9SS type A sorting domain-containing protein [Bacteroidota bacterium]
MKKTLLTLTLALAFIGAQAQCTPDPQYTAAGIYPDSATGLLPATVGIAYNQNITIIVPSDTIVDVFGQMVSLTIDKIDLTSVTGLPSSFSYSCDPPSCGFPGGTIKCAELSSASPTSAEIGLHQIIFETTTTVGGGLLTQDDVIDYYYLQVSGITSTINQFDNTTFELKGAYPNPVSNQAKIQFVSGTTENITFKIYNLLGEEIESQLISSSKGVNTINLNTSSYAEGIYLYSINNGNKVLTKRMIIKN